VTAFSVNRGQMFLLEDGKPGRHHGRPGCRATTGRAYRAAATAARRECRRPGGIAVLA
jgi:hypothetical protein